MSLDSVQKLFVPLSANILELPQVLAIEELFFRDPKYYAV
jgi:hypothetical protein